MYYLGNLALKDYPALSVSKKKVVVQMKSKSRDKSYRVYRTRWCHMLKVEKVKVG